MMFVIFIAIYLSISKRMDRSHRKLTKRDYKASEISESAISGNRGTKVEMSEIESEKADRKSKLRAKPTSRVTKSLLPNAKQGSKSIKQLSSTDSVKMESKTEFKVIKMPRFDSAKTVKSSDTDYQPAFSDYNPLTTSKLASDFLKTVKDERSISMGRKNLQKKYQLP